MAVPPIVKATIQAAVINAGSNVLAQSIKAYRNDVSTSLLTLLNALLLRKLLRISQVLNESSDAPRTPTSIYMDGLATSIKITILSLYE